MRFPNLTAEYATRGLARAVTRSRHSSHVGLTVLAYVRLGVAGLIILHAVLAGYTIPADKLWLTLITSAGYILYAVGQYRATQRLRRRSQIDRLRFVEMGLDLFFATLILFVNSGQDSLAPLVFLIPIVLVSWYYSLIATSLVVGAAFLLSIGADASSLVSHTAPLWFIMARATLFALTGFGIQLMRALTIRQTIDAAKAELDTSREGGYLISPDYTLLYVNPILSERHGPATLAATCYAHLAGRTSPCEGCPLQQTIEHDLLDANRLLSFRDRLGHTYPVDITALRVPGHDGRGRPLAARGHVRFSPSPDPTLEVSAEERAQLLELAYRAGQRVDALLDLGFAVLGEEDRALPEILKTMRAHVGQVIDVTHWYIALHDQTTNTIQFPIFYAHGQPVEFPARAWDDRGYTEWVLRHHRSLLIPDRTDPACPQPVPGIDDQYPYCCWAGVPLRVEQQVFGVMVVQSETSDFYQETDLELLELCAAQVALVLAGVLRRQALLQNSDGAQRWQLEAVSTTPTGDTVEQLLQPLFTIIQQTIPYHAASLQINVQGQLRIVASDGFDNPVTVRQSTFDLNDDLPNTRVYHTRQVCFWPDIRPIFQTPTDPHWHIGQIAAFQPLDEQPRSWLGLPLLRRPSGEPVGVVALDRFEADYYHSPHAAKAAILAPFLADRMVQAYDYVQRWIHANRFATLKLISGDVTEKDKSDPHVPVQAARLIAEAFGLTVGLFIRQAEHVQSIAWVSPRGLLNAPPQVLLDALQLASVEDQPVMVPELRGAMCVEARLGNDQIAWLCGVPTETSDPLTEEDLSILHSALHLLAPYLTLRATALQRSSQWAASLDRADLSDLLDALDISALSENADGYITYANQHLLSLLGYTRTELLGQHFLTLVPVAEHEKVKREFQGRATGLSSKYSSCLLDKAGHSIPVLVDAQPKLDGQHLRRVVVSFVAETAFQHNRQLFDQLAHATSVVRLERTHTPAHILRAVREGLRTCGLGALVLQLDADGQHLRVRDVSIEAGLLRRLKEVYGFQLLGLEFVPVVGTRWHAVVARQQAMFEANGPGLIADMAPVSGPHRLSPHNLRRLAQTLNLGSAIVVPVTDRSGVSWILSVWGNPLRSEDLAPIAAFWREATDALAFSEDRLRHHKRRTPNLQLYQTRDQLKPWASAILQLTRTVTFSDSVGLFGVDAENGALYPIAVEGLYPSRALEDYEQPIQRGIAGWAAVTEQCLVANDVWFNPYFEQFLPEERNVLSEIAVPIKLRGSVVAVLDCQSNVRDAYPPDKEEAITEVARKIEQALTQTPNTRWTGLEESLSAMENLLAGDADPRGTYSRYAHLIADILSAEECSIWLTSDDHTYLTLEGTKRLQAVKARGPRQLVGVEDGVGFTGYVAASGEALRLFGSREVHTHPKWRGDDFDSLEHYAAGQCESLLAVPIPAADGQLPCAGVLKCENKIGPGNPPQFTGEDEARLREFARLISTHLPDWNAQTRRAQQINDELRQAYRDQLHEVRGNLYAATQWRIESLLDNWADITDRVKRSEIQSVADVLAQSMSVLLSIEMQVVTDTDTLGRIGPALRTLAAKFGLQHCISLEGDTEDYVFADKRVAGALIQFGKEALQNAARYSKVDRRRTNQIHLRLDTDLHSANLMIEDHGVGLRQDVRPSDFEVLRNVVESIGGDFDYTNRPAYSRGLQVRAHVPLIAVVHAPTPASTATIH